jgi:hypothetical protein
MFDSEMKVFFTFQWVCFWSLSACLQFTMTYLEANLPNLKEAV